MTPQYKWAYMEHTQATGTINGLAGVVTRVQFSVTVTDADYVAPQPVPLDPQPEDADPVSPVMAPLPQQPSYILISSRDLSAPDPQNFVPASDLKGAMLLGWAKADLGAEACLLYESDAAKGFMAQVSPPTQTVRLED